MDSSWLEILPLPKSRPGWMAAIILAILGIIPFWALQPFAHVYLFDMYQRTYEEQYHPDNGYLSLNVTMPRFVDITRPYSVSVEVFNASKSEVDLKSIQVVQSFKSNKYSNIQIDSPLKPRESFENTFLLAMPKDVKSGDEIEIEVEIYGSQNDPYLSNITYRSFVVADRWSALQSSVSQNLVDTNNGLFLIIIFAVISVWIVEYKKHQDIWLSSKEGWNSVRIIFLKALRIFLPMIIAVGVVFGFPDYLGQIIFGTLIIFLLGWLFQPNISQMLNRIKQRKEQDNKKGERATPDQQIPPDEAEQSVQAKPRRKTTKKT